VKAVQQLENERNGIEAEMAYKYAIDKNCIPQCDSFLDNGYTKEEMKLTQETKKILDPAINVTATAVRVPVVGGHSEAVNIEFENDFDLTEIRQLLHQQAGIELKDDPTTYTYPMPIFAEGKDAVFVGRIRRDESQANTLNLWIVADNLRKGAATNAVQIAHLLLKNGLV
jgi:aspartate-semialdehyde dehydrogenase